MNRKLRLLDRMKDRLADREEEMADLRAELERFEARYIMSVGRLYAEQDEIDAEIAEEELKLVPDDEEIKKRVEELRRLAEVSAARLKAAEENAATVWEPTPEARKAYHSIARAIHPDLALDPKEKERRHTLMAELNRAYASGDQRKLDRLVADFRISPETVIGDSVGDRLIRAIRQIHQIRTRFRELETENLSVENSELYDLFFRAKSEAAEGRDLLKQMAGRAETHIKRSRRRLENLKSVTAAQERHVLETFGLDIGDFRKKR